MAAPTVFVNKEKGIRLVAWGKDFMLVGRDRELKESADMLKQ